MHKGSTAYCGIKHFRGVLSAAVLMTTVRDGRKHGGSLSHVHECDPLYHYRSIPSLFGAGPERRRRVWGLGSLALEPNPAVRRVLPTIPNAAFY
jgi:hypothetical protein